jgi:hypothetical protein
MRERALDRPLEVAEGEHGLVRVFALDHGAGPAERWRDTGSADWPLPAALGVDRLVAEDVQVFTPQDLAGMSLADFLATGYEIGSDQLDPDRTALERATAGDGRTLLAVLRSGAVADRPATLAPAGGVRLIGLYAEPGATPALAPMPDVQSARPTATRAASATVKESGDGEASGHVLERFRPDRDIYIRDHLWMAALGMIGAVGVLYLMGNGHPWIGAPAALLAIAVHGAYLASEELGQRWDLTTTEVAHVDVDGRRTRGIPLAAIATVRKLGSGVQVVATGGDKLMLKYLSAPDTVRARLERATGDPR